MADPNSPAIGQKARILIDGENPVPGTTFVADPDGIVFAEGADADGNVFLRAVASGSTTLTATADGRTGSDDITVPEAPLVVTLDTPIPA